MRPTMKRITALLLLFLTSCATVNVYVTFPEEKIRKAAEDLLGPPPSTAPAKESTSLLDLTFAASAEAAETSVSRDLKTSSPVIEETKAQREKWRTELEGYKRQGYIGESNRFSVEIRTLPADPKVASAVTDLVRKENSQRDTMIRELLRINGAPPSDEKRFRDIFSAVMRERFSAPGDWVQQPDGTWVRKP